MNDTISKVAIALAIAAVTGCFTWTMNANSRLSVNETRIDNFHAMLMEEEKKLEAQKEKTVGIEKHIIEIFNDMRDIQRQQLEISKTQTAQWDVLKDNLTSVKEELSQLRGYVEGKEKG